MDIEERKRLIEQTRKELIKEFLEYEQGMKVDSGVVTGKVFVVPLEKYKEWVS